jgi:hypothetical protein
MTGLIYTADSSYQNSSQQNSTLILIYGCLFISSHKFTNNSQLLLSMSRLCALVSSEVNHIFLTLSAITSALKNPALMEH